MKITSHRWIPSCLALVFATTGTLVMALPPKLMPEPAPLAEAATFAPDASRWSIGAGIVFREIEGDFSLTSPGPPPGALLGGRGDVGLHSGRNGEKIHYDDGTVGPGFGINDGPYNRGNPVDGTVYTVSTSGSQFTDTGRVTNFFGTPIYNLAFHTSLGIYEPQTFHSSDEEMGVGPYVEVRYAVIRGAKMDVNLTLGYSWVTADLASGTGKLATYERHDYTYNYDYDIFFSSFEGLLPGSPGLNLNGPFPFADWGYAITNPNGLFAEGLGFHSPYKTHEVTKYVLRGQADLDVDLHEMVLAPEVMVDLWKCVHVGISVGPTLNFIDTDLDATAAWYRASGGKPIQSYEAHGGGTDVKLGVASQVTLTVDLTKRLYLQASGSYRYVPDVDVEAGWASVNVDTTAWQGAVGFGVRL